MTSTFSRTTGKDFRSILDLDAPGLRQLIDLGTRLKSERRLGP